MNLIVSHLMVLLAGVAIGSLLAVNLKMAYDRRRAETEEQEAVEEFQQVEAQMPGLMAEMRADLGAEETRLFREFLPVEGGPGPEPNDPTLAYSADRHPDLDRQLAVLRKHAYIVDITSGNAPRFRMAEEFVRLLQKNKVPLRYSTRGGPRPAAREAQTTSR